MACKHRLVDVWVKDCDTYVKIDFKYCLLCQKLFRETLSEVRL
jgi:hypothetical protein